MFLDIIISTLKRTNPEIGDFSRLSSDCVDLPEMEKKFVDKLSEGLKKEYKNLKSDYNFNASIVAYADYTKILAFGSKIGLEVKERLDDIINY